MGFKERIYKSVHDELILHNLYEDINDAMSKLHEIDFLKSESDLEKITFSDSIVISHDNTSEGAIRIIFYSQIIAWNLAQKGYFVRGGIASGKLYHKSNFIFGPVLIEAYSLESKKAIFPRVMLSKNVYEKVKNGFRWKNKKDFQLLIFPKV